MGLRARLTRDARDTPEEESGRPLSRGTPVIVYTGGVGWAIFSRRA